MMGIKNKKVVWLVPNPDQFIKDHNIDKKLDELLIESLKVNK